MNEISELAALVDARFGKATQFEIAVVSEVSGAAARVKRQGQTVSTRLIPLVSGLSVSVGDRVQLVKINGSINAAFIAAKV